MIYKNTLTNSFYKRIDNHWHFKMHSSNRMWIKLAINHLDEKTLVALSPVFVLLYDLEE